MVFELKRIWKYNLSFGVKWVRCDDEGIMNHPRCIFGSASLGSIAIVAGGFDQYGNILKSAELYDSSTCRWEMLPDMQSPRKLCSAFFMDEKFYVVGGRKTHANDEDSLTCGEEFDLKTKQWRKIDGMYPFIIANNKNITEASPLVAVVGDELYAVDYASSMVVKYDKNNNNSWEIFGRTSDYRFFGGEFGFIIQSLWGRAFSCV